MHGACPSAHLLSIFDTSVHFLWKAVVANMCCILVMVFGGAPHLHKDSQNICERQLSVCLCQPCDLLKERATLHLLYRVSNGPKMSIQVGSPMRDTNHIIKHSQPS